MVVDSIAFHVRANTELTYAKPLHVGQMAQLLSHAARRAHRASSCSSTRRPRAPTRCSALVGWRPRWARRGRTCATCRLSLEWCDGVRLAALSKGRGPGEAQFAVTADGIRSADPSTKLLRPPRPVEAALAPPRLQRWPDAGCRCSPRAQMGGYGLLEPLAHGTKQVHEQASSSSSAVENLQPQQLARSS